MIKSLTIGADEYEVVYIKDSHAWGYCDAEKKKIELCKGISVKDRNVTLLHEGIHGVLASYGLTIREEIEELTVRSLEVGLCRLFQDNPKFTRELVGSLKKK